MKLYIKYMVSMRCKLVVEEELKKLGLHYVSVDFGVIETVEVLTREQRDQLRMKLFLVGLELLEDKRNVIIEKIKSTVMEIIHNTEESPKANYSDILTGKLGYEYTYLSNLFSEVNGMTIQQFIINQKIEKIKEMLMYSDMNISEISYKMHYSSVAHMSAQFKKVTGHSPTYFRELKLMRESSDGNMMPS
jgi:AraC-like DNA-binding protein